MNSARARKVPSLDEPFLPLRRVLYGRGPEFREKGGRATILRGALDRDDLDRRDGLAALEELGEVLPLVPEPAFGDDRAARGKDLLLAVKLGVDRLSREVEGVEVAELDGVVGGLGKARERDVGVAADHALERDPLEDSHVLDAPPELGEEDFGLFPELEVRPGPQADVRGPGLAVVHLRLPVHVGQASRVLLEPDLLDGNPLLAAMELDVHETRGRDLHGGARETVLLGKGRASRGPLVGGVFREGAIERVGEGVGASGRLGIYYGKRPVFASADRAGSALRAGMARAKGLFGRGNQNSNLEKHAGLVHLALSVGFSPSQYIILTSFMIYLKIDAAFFKLP